MEKFTVTQLERLNELNGDPNTAEMEFADSVERDGERAGSPQPWSDQRSSLRQTHDEKRRSGTDVGTVADGSGLHQGHDAYHHHEGDAGQDDHR